MAWHVHELLWDKKRAEAKWGQDLADKSVKRRMEDKIMKLAVVGHSMEVREEGSIAEALFSYESKEKSLQKALDSALGREKKKRRTHRSGGSSDSSRGDCRGPMRATSSCRRRTTRSRSSHRHRTRSGTSPTQQARCASSNPSSFARAPSRVASPSPASCGSFDGPDDGADYAALGFATPAPKESAKMTSDAEHRRVAIRRDQPVRLATQGPDAEFPS